MDLIESHFQKLQAQYPEATLSRRPDGSALVVIPNFLLPSGWSSQQTSILFVVPVGYPAARPDCFWADAGLRLSSGGQPSNTSVNANYGGAEQRLWFSFHPGSWHPTLDDLVTYTKLIKSRFERRQ